MIDNLRLAAGKVKTTDEVVFFKKMANNEKHIENLIKINSVVIRGVLSHFDRAGLQYVDVPQIVGITGACENIDTLFKIGNRLDLPLFFTQTGQLTLEQALTFSPGVYTIIHSGRDEEEEDSRHLRQFRLIEEEFDCTLAGMTVDKYDEEIMFESLLSHIEATVKAMIRSAVVNHSDLLREFFRQDLDALEEVIDWHFLRITYEEAIKLLRETHYTELSFGDDLKANHEQEVIKLVNQRIGRENVFLPVFITHYPKEIKFFNMKVSSRDRSVVLSSDLILPISGEAVGSAVREHDREKLKERLLTSQMFKLHQKRGGSYKDFSWYVDDLVGASKSQPHAGYGVGTERVLQFILGLEDIRQCSIFQLMGQLTGDWDRSRKGKLHLYSPHKKSILLSIGRVENKKRLLPSIAQIYGENSIFYATKKTHEFLRQEGIISTRVHKISEKDEPNIKTLLEKGTFDIIINTPTRKSNRGPEETDGEKIRKAAIESGTTLITEVKVAEYLLGKLAGLGGEDKTESFVRAYQEKIGQARKL